NDYLDDGVTGTWFIRQGATGKYQKTNNLGTSKGPNKGCSLVKLMRLGANWSSLKSQIDSMSATGNTDIPLGLSWGWFTLSPNAPFSDGVPYLTPKHTKIVILMTDGDNLIQNNNGNKNVTDYSGAGYVWQGRVKQASGVPLSGANSEGQRTA